MAAVAWKDGDFAWVTNWTWREKPKPKKVAGKLVMPEGGDDEPVPEFPAKISGKPSGTSCNVNPLWSRLCPKCGGKDEHCEESHPEAITIPLGGEATGPQLVAMGAANREPHINAADLDDVHTSALVYNLRLRYQAKPSNPATWAGETLLSAVPLPLSEALPHTPESMSRYRGRVMGEHGMAPHAYAVAEALFTRAVGRKEPQSVIMNGESGSGKSESARRIVDYVLNRAGPASAAVAAKVAGATALLTAVSTAKTRTHSHATRACHQIDVFISPAGAVVGGRVALHGLERARVCHQEAGERNFDMLYALVAGAAGPLKTEAKLTRPDDFRYLSGGSDAGDRELWTRLTGGLTALGIPEAVQQRLWRSLAAVLHVGQLAFQDGSSGATISGGDVGTIATLLSVDKDALESGFKVRKGAGDPRPYTARQAKEAADLFAKGLYEATVTHFLEEHVNRAMAPEGEHVPITVMDQYGWESYHEEMKEVKAGKKDIWIESSNTIEQLLINTLNEQLQECLHEAMLPRRAERAKADGVDKSAPAVPSLHLSIEAVTEGVKTSVYGILDNTSKISGTDRTLAEDASLADKRWIADMKKAFGDKALMGERTAVAPLKNRKDRNDFVAFLKHDPKHSKDTTDFNVFHSIGMIWYTSAGAVERNKENVPVDLIGVLGASTDSSVAALIKPPEDPKAEKQMTAARRMVETMQKLKESLAQLANPLLVQCLRPNCVNEAGLFEDHKAITMLAAAGIAQTMEARKAPSVEYTAAEFVSAFRMLEPDEAALAGKSPADLVSLLAAKAGPDAGAMQVGKTYVHLSDRLHAALLAEVEKAHVTRRVKMAIGYGHLKALFLLWRDWRGHAQRVADYEKIKARITRKRALVASGKTLDAAEKAMWQEDEDEYRATALAPVQQAAARSVAAAPALVEAIDAFVKGAPHYEDTSGVGYRKSALNSAVKRVNDAVSRMVAVKHDQPYADAIAAVHAGIQALDALTKAEPALLEADAHKREEAVAERARKEAEEREKIYQAHLATMLWELDRGRRERQAVLEAEREKREKVRAEKREKDQVVRRELLAVKEREREMEKKEKQKERWERRQELKSMEREIRKENRARKRVDRKRATRSEALIGTMVVYEHLLCRIKYLGPMPYDGSSEFAGIECPSAIGTMNDGHVAGVKLMEVAPGTGKFVHPSTLHLVKTGRHEVAVGDRVWQKDTTRIGTVRYIGGVSEQQGTWVGVQLSQVGSGKNDGSVRGRRYFTCPPLTGLFIRPNQLFAVVPWSDQLVDAICHEFTLINPSYEFSSDSTSESDGEIEKRLFGGSLKEKIDAFKTARDANSNLAPEEFAMTSLIAPPSYGGAGAAAPTAAAAGAHDLSSNNSSFGEPGITIRSRFEPGYESPRNNLDSVPRTRPFGQSGGGGASFTRASMGSRPARPSTSSARRPASVLISRPSDPPPSSPDHYAQKGWAIIK